MLVSIRPGYSAASCYIVTGLGPLESLYNLCLRLFAQVTREAAFCHIDGPRSIRESLHACVHSPRWRQRSAIICESPCILVFIHPGHSGAAFSNITTGLDPLENLCMLVFIPPGYLGAGTLRRALGLLESLSIVVFILVCGFAAVLDPLWKALLQALHSREIFSCTTDTGNERKTFHFSREAIWKRYTHSGMCCCQPYTRERTSHAPQTSGKRKSKNAKGLSHEVRPPTQRPVLKCLGRTVRPYSTVLTLEEPATGTARERGGGLSHEVSPPTPECIGRTVRPCSAASFEESATGTARERGVLSHEVSPRYLSVLGEPFDHAPLPLSMSLPLGRCASNERLSHEVLSPTQR